MTGLFDSCTAVREIPEVWLGTLPRSLGMVVPVAGGGRGYRKSMIIRTCALSRHRTIPALPALLRSGGACGLWGTEGRCRLNDSGGLRGRTLEKRSGGCR